VYTCDAGTRIGAVVFGIIGFVALSVRQENVASGAEVDRRRADALSLPDFPNVADVCDGRRPVYRLVLHARMMPNHSLRPDALQASTTISLGSSVHVLYNVLATQSARMPNMHPRRRCLAAVQRRLTRFLHASLVEGSKYGNRWR
jgi:hypothetical protein